MLPGGPRILNYLRGLTNTGSGRQGAHLLRECRFNLPVPSDYTLRTYMNSRWAAVNQHMNSNSKQVIWKFSADAAVSLLQQLQETLLALLSEFGKTLAASKDPPETLLHSNLPAAWQDGLPLLLECCPALLELVDQPRYSLARPLLWQRWKQLRPHLVTAAHSRLAWSATAAGQEQHRQEQLRQQ